MSTATPRPISMHGNSAMSAATGPPARLPSSPAIGDAVVIRFLTGFSATLLPLLAAVVALEIGWPLLGVSTWPTAGAVVTGWALTGTAWLCRRGWPGGALLAVIGAPLAVLAGVAGLGWLSPAGLVLWGPVSTVLAAALAMAAQPMGPAAPSSAKPPARDGPTRPNRHPRRSLGRPRRGARLPPARTYARLTGG